MYSIVARKSQGTVYRSLNAREKSQAALETLRGVRSVAEIAEHWQVSADDLLQWQHTVVDRAASLFGEQQDSPAVQLAQVQQVNQALIEQVFAQMDAREDLQHSTKQLQRLMAQQDQRKEEERKRLALEIHDELAQNLLAIRIDISMLQERTRIRHPQLHRRVGLVLSNIDGAIKASRSIINDLRPFELELGLPAAVQWQLNRFERASGVAVQLAIDGFDVEGRALADEVTLNVFRTLQESLGNVAQHAGVSCVRVSLSQCADRVQLVVQDDGAGAERGAARAGDGVGLAGMRERIGALGGELSVDNPASGGTRLQSWIPLPMACQV